MKKFLRIPRAVILSFSVVCVTPFSVKAVDVVPTGAEKTLNKLIQIAKDSEQGYQAAARDIENVELRSKFESISRERRKFIEELIPQVRLIGAKPKEKGSVGAAIHRKWINVKSAITGSNEQSIMEEIVSGESLTVAAYEQALQEPMPLSAQALIARQAAEVSKTYLEIKSLQNKIAYKQSIEKNDLKNFMKKERQSMEAASAISLHEKTVSR